MYEDTELRWEMLATIKQITCLVSEPERIEHNDDSIVPNFGRKMQDLAARAQLDHRYHYPTQSEYARLLEKLNLELVELMIIQLNKHRIWCEEQSASYRWSDHLRTLYKSQSTYLVDVIAMLAQGEITKVMTEVLPKRPPIIDVRLTTV